MRYNKASIHSTMRAALATVRKNGGIRYVFATAYGYKISDRRPDFHQAFYCIGVEGWALAEWDSQRGCHTWSKPQQWSQATAETV